jgi:hypothetical protein
VGKTLGEIMYLTTNHISDYCCGQKVSYVMQGHYSCVCVFILSQVLLPMTVKGKSFLRRLAPSNEHLSSLFNTSLCIHFHTKHNLVMIYIEDNKLHFQPHNNLEMDGSIFMKFDVEVMLLESRPQ